MENFQFIIITGSHPQVVREFLEVNKFLELTGYDDSENDSSFVVAQNSKECWVVDNDAITTTLKHIETQNELATLVTLEEFKKYIINNIETEFEQV